jgi:hypothetical protein
VAVTSSYFRPESDAASPAKYLRHFKLVKYHI